MEGIDALKEEREGQRLDLISALFERAQNEQAGQADQTIFLRLVSNIIESFLNRREGLLDMTGPKDDIDILYMSMQATIRYFAQTEEEANYLVGQFLGKLITSIVSPLTNVLLEQETRQPEKIFNVEPKPVAQPP